MLNKYNIIYPSEIRSSLLLASFPLYTFGETYAIVPLNLFVNLGKICFPVLEDLYFLHKPKSIIYIVFGSSIPIKKFSGLTSLYSKFLEWIYSSLSNICNAIKHASDKLHLFSVLK